MEKVIRHLAKYKKGKRAYYRARSQNTETLSSARRAARFIFLNDSASMEYHTTGDGLFNVLYGARERVCFPPRKHCVINVRRASVSARSFERTLEEVRAANFVYLDPPYSIQSRRVFNEYSHFSFGTKELRVLA